MSKFSCGIDFGTTNTSAAVTSAEIQPELVNVEDKHVTIPSALFFDAFDNHITFGREAMQNYMLGGQGRFMRSLKRVLGTDLMNIRTQINDTPMLFEQILSHFIRHIRHKIEIRAGAVVESVVMGRPVHFRDNDPAGDKKAGEELERIARLAGFKQIDFQFEPIAAAFAHEIRVKGEKLACVIDIGGGTSDFTVIRLGEKHIAKTDRSSDILASTGVRIGGNDFDRDLSLQAFMPELGQGSLCRNKIRPDETMSVPNAQFFDLSEWSSINSLYSYASVSEVRKTLMQSLEPKKYGRLLEIMEKELGHKLLNRVEETKINLTTQDKYCAILEFISDKPKIMAERGDFEKAVSRNIQNISLAVDECKKQAGIKTEQIELIVLTGGSTEIPAVKNSLCSHFPQAKISQEDKLSSVGFGLAYDAKRKF